MWSRSVSGRAFFLVAPGKKPRSSFFGRKNAPSPFSEGAAFLGSSKNFQASDALSPMEKGVFKKKYVFSGFSEGKKTG